ATVVLAGVQGRCGEAREERQDRHAGGARARPHADGAPRVGPASRGRRGRASGRAHDRGAAGARASSPGEQAASSGARNFKSGGHLLRQGERMRYAFIAEKRVAFPVAARCRAMRVSRSGFYGYLAEPQTARERGDAGLSAKTRAVFAEPKGRYGSPRVCSELRERGDLVSAKRVARLMRENGLVARKKKRFRATTDSKHDDPIAPNLLDRDFTASGPNEVWATDVTAVWTQS